MVVLDNGYVNTGSTLSEVTFLNGERHTTLPSYPIEELAENSSFLEVVYLLIYKELPNEKEFAQFTRRITMHTMIHEDLKRLYDGFPKDSHPCLSSLL